MMAGSDGLTYILHSTRIRANCCEAVVHAPNGSRVTIRPPRRSLDQNAKLHAMICDIIRQHPVVWDGQAMDEDCWKAALMRAIGCRVKMLPSPLEEVAVVVVAPRTSALTVSQFAEMIECLYAKGAEWGIKWSEPELWQHPAPIGEAE